MKKSKIHHPDRSETTHVATVDAVQGVVHNLAGMPTNALCFAETEHDLTIRCDKRLTIICGQAMLVLEPDGTIIIRGSTIESSATGDHRLRGATIGLN